ncbi:MAG TPA: serine protease [Blastocatellia bacterium]|nr:serine protease [Blastocatellia bacterium]
MKRHVTSLASAALLLLIPSLDCSAQDTLSRVAKLHQPYTITVALEFSKKNRNPMLRALAAVGAIDPNAHATGFFVGESLVMTSYHVVSGKLNARKKKLLGFKPDDELEVKVYVHNCQAKVVKVDEGADLALLKICSSRQGLRPTFRTSLITDEQLLLIAQPGEQKLIRRGSFKGSYAFGGAQFWSVKIDGQDGFSGSPVYDNKGEIVGVFSLYDYERGVALLCPSVRVQQFLAEYDAGSQTHQ